jgi:hypothetical protein
MDVFNMIDLLRHCAGAASAAPLGAQQSAIAKMEAR